MLRAGDSCTAPKKETMRSARMRALDSQYFWKISHQASEFKNNAILPD